MIDIEIAWLINMFLTVIVLVYMSEKTWKDAKKLLKEQKEVKEE